MKAIEFVIYENVHDGEVARDGQFQFSLYTSNMCDGEMEEVMPVLVKLWDFESEVTLKVNMKARDLLMGLLDLHVDRNGCISEEDKPMFDALRNDCQWMIEHIDKLKVEHDQT
jgi:hypothetical protein